MAGCDTFSWAASSVSLHGPSRDNLARVNAAVELSSPGTASRRHMDTSCSSAPASSSHSAPVAALAPVPVTGVVITQNYIMHLYMRPMLLHVDPVHGLGLEKSTEEMITSGLSSGAALESGARLIRGG